MSEVVKRLVSYFPEYWQEEFKRIHYRRAIRKGRFSPDEPDDAKLESYINIGDWVVDVGANIGHYTKRFSDLVGQHGRVIAMEPIPQTFAQLSANVRSFSWPNVTLLNVAASDTIAEVGMVVPYLNSGMKNYYMAHIGAKQSDIKVLALPVDVIGLSRRVSLVKIDVEGHEYNALVGMKGLVLRDMPTLIVETHSSNVCDLLGEWGYVGERLPGSPNILFTPSGDLKVNESR